MKKKIYKYIILTITFALSALCVFAAEKNNNDINIINNKPNDVQTSIKSIKETAKKNSNYPVIDAFKPSENNENVTVKAGIETNAIMSLDDAIKLALANNPAIMSAISNTEIYKSKIGQAWSGYFPTISAGIGYDRTKPLMPMLSGSIEPYNYFKTVNLTAEEKLFDFGKTKKQADIAKKSYAATQDNLQATINDIIYSVKESYYSLLYAIQKENVYEDTVLRYEMHLKQSRAYYDLGVKPKLDILTAEYNLSNAQLGLIKAKNEIDIATAKLNNAMGLPEQAHYSIDEKINLKKYEYKFESMLTQAYDMRPELLASKKKAEASKIAVTASKLAFTPDLNISASYNLGGTTPGKDYGYAFGGNLSYPVTNLMLLKKQMDEAKAVYNKDSADFEKNKQNVYLDVKNAYLTLFETEKALPVAKNAMRQAQEQYELASGRYKIGVGEIIELKDAEDTYRNSQLEYYASILKYNVAIANLEKVVGAPIEQIAKVINNTNL